MRRLAHILLAAALWLTSFLAVHAQEDEKGFLTRTLQDALSGAGRAVSIDGFRGALSSSASFDRMTIADDDGIWLTLEDVVLEWNRSALLRGRLEVAQLTAEKLELPRAPKSDPDALPAAEAAPFSLPDLPVSVSIETFSIAQINLGAPLLGEEAQLSITASARLTDVDGDIDLTAARTDGQRGQFSLKANFERSDQLLDLLLDLSEGEGGIAARVLDLPGQPSVDMKVEGSGPIDEFTADVAVRTDGQERLAGSVTLAAQAPRRASDTPDRRVQAGIRGDITTLLAPQYREFFGDDVRLSADALIEGNGAVELSAFELTTAAAQLRGKVALDANTWPVLIDIDGQIANPDGTPTLLPLGGQATTVEAITLRVDYDAANGEAINADFDLTALAMPDVGIAQVSLGLDGTLQSAQGSFGAFDGDVDLAARGVTLRDADLAQAVGENLQGSARVSYNEGQPIEISNLALSGADYALTGDAVIEGIETGLRNTIGVSLTAEDLARFSGLAGRQINGATALELEGTVVPLSGQFDLTAEGRTDDLRVGVEQADAVLAGRTTLSLAARRNEQGTFVRDLVLQNAALRLNGGAALRSGESEVEAEFTLSDIAKVVPQYGGPVTIVARATQDGRGWSVDAATDGPYNAALTARGLATGPDARLRFTADVPEINRFTPELDGPVKASGTLSRTPDGWQVETEATGPYQVAVAAAGLVAPTIAMDFDLSMPDVSPVVPQMRGALSVSGAVRQEPNGYFVRTSANGPFGLTAAVEGLATGPDMRLVFDAALPNVRPLAPGISGPLSLRGLLRQTPDGIAVDTSAAGPYSLQAAVDGIVTGPNAAVRFDASMPNIGALVDNINGPLRLSGNARKAGDGWQVTTDADGPSGTQATVSGRVNGNGTLNLQIAGNAPLGLGRPFLAPRDLQGQARFDLAVNGAPALSSVSGDVRIDGATFTAPNLRVALQDIAGDVALARNRAQIDLRGAGSNGGQLRLGGGITLTSSFPADLQIGLSSLVVIDPRLYRTSLGGDLRVAGPLRGGAQISGQVDVGETTVNVPSTGLTNIGDIPPINHIGATRPVMSTQRKAGVTNDTSGDAAGSGGGTPFGLNLSVNAPNRIFVRGRGLDAELGGSLRLTGTTQRVISAGRFDLLRGRLDILGKRFELREGSIQFQGGLVPFIRFVSATETSTGEVRVVVEGPTDAPTVSFEATPEAPEDEVLAQLLFGRNISEISPLQALQLANAVATLAGRGGVNVIANLRAGFGLDDLDLTTNDDGTTAVRAGKYISENVYTDVTAASDGTGEVSLNLDITPNLKGKATLGSDGNSGIGIFFEKDY